MSCHLITVFGSANHISDIYPRARYTLTINDYDKIMFENNVRNLSHRHMTANTPVASSF